MGRGRSTVFASLLGVAALAVVFWAGRSVMHRALKMAPRDMSGAAFAKPAPGASAHLVIEVLSVGTNGQLTGRLLEVQRGSYHLTSTRVTAEVPADPTVLMGVAADIKPRAVLELSGRLDEQHRVRVDRVVVLTDYVTVAH